MGVSSIRNFQDRQQVLFDSLVLTDISMQVPDYYLNFVRPLLTSQCNFILVTKNGGHHNKLGDVMSKLVFGAIR